MHKQKIPIAVEGYPFIFFAALTTLTLTLLSLVIPALAALLITGFILWFFRDPERIVPEDTTAIIAPADGKVISIDKVFDERFLHEHVYKISIFMNIFNVHVNRIPFSGTVERIQLQPGSFYSANSKRGTLKNEHCAVIVQSGQEQRYAVVQMAGLIARRIVCWLEKGDTIKTGSRFGLIRFGSRVDLYLSTEAQLEVVSGQHVKAGETVLGYF